MKKISVVIPVYNAMTAGGGYLHRCIDSVIHQKNFFLKDIEILLINDGSSDNSQNVIDDYAKKYPKCIVPVSQKNIGVAKTRNKAIKLAKGEYIIFIDQDDWIDNNYFETLYNAIRLKNLDYVYSGYRRPDDRGKSKKVLKFDHRMPNYSRYLLSAAWAKIHKTSFLRDNDITFFSNSYGEDIPFTAKEINSSDMYAYIKYVGYNWFINEKSVSNTTQKSLSKSNSLAIERLFSNLESFEANGSQYRYFMLRTAIYSLLSSGRMANRYQFNELYKKMPETLFTKSRKLRYIFPPKGEKASVRCVVSVFVVISNLGLVKMFARIWCKG